MAPIIDGRADIIEVKQSAENEYADTVHRGLSGAVFTSGCTNWYFDKFGRNIAHWHGHGRTFWYETMLPQGRNFFKLGGSRMGRLNMFWRWIKTTDSKVYVAMLLFLIGGLNKPLKSGALDGPLSNLSGALQSLRSYVI